nr:RNA-dependent RNA polymerase [Botryosphaeria dothidea partitivirus 2]
MVLKVKSNLGRFSQLRPGHGFNSDLRTPAPDKSALVSARKVFGSSTTDKVLNRYHRPTPSLDLLREGVLKYDCVLPPRHFSPEYSAALDSLRREFIPEKKIIPLTLGAVYNHPDFPRGKSPGLPWSNEGYRTKADVVNSAEARSTISRTWDLVGKNHPVQLPDSCCFQRLQISDPSKDKVRPVWGYPTTVIVEEGRFFYPFIQHVLGITQHDHCYAGGLEMATGGMAYIEQVVQSTFNKMRNRFVMIDWSSFDTRVPAWLIRDIFDLISESFDFEHVQDSEGKIWHVNPVQSRRRWAKLISYFINTPIRLPNGDRYRKASGVPSGSMFTNFVDTLCNATVCRFLSFHCTGSFPEHDLYMGDDGNLLCRGVVNLEDWSRLAADVFGFVLSVDKSWTTVNPDNVHFLGFYNRNGLPKRSNEFLVASYVYPERTVRDPIETCSRAVGQLYSCLDSRLAFRWLEVVEEVLIYHGLTFSDVDEFINSHPGKFKYLSTLGIDPRAVSSATTLWNPLGQLWNVVPPLSPRRNYQGRHYRPDEQRFYIPAS